MLEDELLEEEDVPLEEELLEDDDAPEVGDDVPFELAADELPADAFPLELVVAGDDELEVLAVDIVFLNLSDLSLGDFLDPDDPPPAPASISSMKTPSQHATNKETVTGC